MAKKNKVEAAKNERYLESYGADAAAYDACFETLDHTDECPKCGAGAYDSSVLPLRGGGYDVQCGICGHVARG